MAHKQRQKNLSQLADDEYLKLYKETRRSWPTVQFLLNVNLGPNPHTKSGARLLLNAVNHYIRELERSLERGEIPKVLKQERSQFRASILDSLDAARKRQLPIEILNLIMTFYMLRKLVSFILIKTWYPCKNTR